MGASPQMAHAAFLTPTISEFASDVVIGLSHPGQKELPSKYLYDEVGSALFDAPGITTCAGRMYAALIEH